MTAVANMKVMKEAKAALNAVSETAPIVLEDEWGQRYELVRTYAIGTNVPDPAVVMKIRMYPKHPDRDRGVLG